ncbi:24221_t:CDS:10 [Cetraspora pellucida]|uniref:24221_t:CDS:1 n=1 Tax=Cetraspora pellucida TaxID=1433469 RepID=A0A9N8ZTD1_9GLOM|nr:24221_t:CDS:10 [Cetraspora pellucida]
MSALENLQNGFEGVLLAFKQFSQGADTKTRCDFLIPPLLRLFDLSSDIDTNKYIVHSLLYKAWQQSLMTTAEDELNYNVIRAINNIDTELYLQLVQGLKLENEFIQTLYAIPRQVILMLIQEIERWDPQFCLRIAYDPALYILNSLDIKHRKELLAILARLIISNATSITEDHQRLELIRSTAKHIENYLSPVSLESISDHELISKSNEYNVVVDYMFSTPFYSYQSVRPSYKVRQQIVRNVSRQESLRIDTVLLIEDLLLNPILSTDEDTYCIFTLLAIFDYIIFVAWFNQDLKDRVKSSISLILRKTVLKLIKSNYFTKLKSEPTSVERNALSNLFKYASDIDSQQQPFKLKPRSDLVIKLQEDKTRHVNVIDHVKNYDLNQFEISTTTAKDIDLNKHEEAFVTICRTVRANLAYDTSFTLRITNSKLFSELSPSTGRPVRKDLEEYCRWVQESISLGLPGYISLLKLMIQYFDLFVGFDYNVEQLAVMILEHGLCTELYQSVKRIIKVFLPKEHNKIVRAVIVLLLKTFGFMSLRTRNVFRDFVLSDRLPTSAIASPTFDSWTIWLFDFEQRLTTICNQLVSSLDHIPTKSTGNQTLGQFDPLKLQIIDSLILLSLISPYHVLHRLVWESIHNKGQWLIILDIIRDVRSICWLRQTPKSPSLFIIVLKDILSQIDDGSVVLTHQEQKNWNEFVVHAMLGNTTKSAIEYTLTEIGEWGNSEILIDIPEYLAYCILTYLQNSSTSLGKKTTLYLALYTLNSLLLPSVSTPRFDLCWFMKSEPFSLLHSLALLFDRRETIVISMKTVDILYALLKEFMRLLTEYVTSIQDDYNQDEKPFVPVLLSSFCELSDHEFTISDRKEISVLDQEKTMKQSLLFLEACRISIDWCKKFSMSLNIAKSISKPIIRNIFLTIAPFSFCFVLEKCVDEESINILDVLLKDLISYGILSATELLLADIECNDMTEHVISEFAIQERISLCCVRYSLINILSALKHIKEKSIKQKREDTTLFFEGNDDYTHPGTINDLHITQNIINVLKASLITQTASLNFLVYIFYTITQALVILSDFSKSEESLYIFLLTVVEMIEKTCIRGLSNDEKEPVNTTKTGKKQRKKKNDNVANTENMVGSITEESTLVGIENDKFSEWRVRLFLSGIDKIKKQSWRNAVKQVLKPYV